MQIRIIQSFATAHGAVPRGSVITVSDELAQGYVTAGIAVAVPLVGIQSETATAIIPKIRTKAISPKAPKHEV